MPQRFLLVALLATLAAPARADDLFQGYVEGEYVRVAAQSGGTLVELSVARGATVAPGAPLFALDRTAEEAAREAAAARVAQASAQLANLQKGARATEIAQLEAQRQQAQAAQTYAQSEAKRQRALVGAGGTARQAFEQAVSESQMQQGRIAELTAAIENARLPAREDEIRAAEAAVQNARADLAQAEWALGQRSRAAPAAAQVTDTLYRVGEFVPAGAPVVELLPPENLKVRFFVPEPALGRLRVGQAVSVGCNGCPESMPARISFIAPEAEFTPPVIYSQERREKLVFMIEAVPEKGASAWLHPGQPVDVTVAEEGAGGG